MATTRERYSIHGDVSPDICARYTRLVEHLQLPKKGAVNGCMAVLLDCYEGQQRPHETTPDDVLNLMGYSPAELETLSAHERFVRQVERVNIESALRHADFWDMLRSGLVREARIRNTQHAKLELVMSGDVAT